MVGLVVKVWDSQEIHAEYLTVNSLGRATMGSGHFRTGRGGRMRTVERGTRGMNSGQAEETEMSEEDASHRAAGEGRNSAPT